MAAQPASTRRIAETSNGTRWCERSLRNPTLGDPAVPARDRIIVPVHSGGEPTSASPVRN